MRHVSGFCVTIWKFMKLGLFWNHLTVKKGEFEKCKKNNE